MIDKKRDILLAGMFIFLFFSFFSNLWYIVPQNHFEEFDQYDKGLIYGKIAHTKQHGIFANSGFSGLNYDKRFPLDFRKDETFTHIMLLQKDMYLGNVEMLPDFYTYKSQPGVQVMFYDLLDQIIPASPETMMRIFDMINALFNAFVFTLFLGWILRNYGYVATIVTFVLLALSSWLILFSSNIWWVAGSFFLPVFGLLMLFEKRNISDGKLLSGIYLLFLSKCLLTGFEFITCTAFSVLGPIIYYFYLNKRSFKSFFIFSVKAGFMCLFAILTVVGIIIIQHKFMYGNFASGIQNLVAAFERQSTGSEYETLSYITYILYLYTYIGNAFDVTHFTIDVPFKNVIIAVYANLVLLFVLSRNHKEWRKYRGLIIVTALALLASGSWYVFFASHALRHKHINHICWYMPFLIFGFLSIGATVSLIVNKYLKRR